MSYKIWYAIYVGTLHQCFTMRRSKKSARSVIRDLKKSFPGLSFDYARLLEKIEPRRKRRRRAKKVPGMPAGVTLRTKGENAL